MKHPYMHNYPRKLEDVKMFDRHMAKQSALTSSNPNPITNRNLNPQLGHSVY